MLHHDGVTYYSLSADLHTSAKYAFWSLVRNMATINKLKMRGFLQICTMLGGVELDQTRAKYWTQMCSGHQRQHEEKI